MNLHEILIVPSAGHSSAEGAYTRGHCLGNMAEIDIVDHYVRAISDALDESSVRHRIMDVRRPPGKPEHLRHEGILPGTLVLDCRVGWSDKAPSKGPKNNSSHVYYMRDHLRTLAVTIAEAIGHWGQIYANHGHRGCRPETDDHPLLATVTGGIRIEPFMLNAPMAEQYVLHLEQLGRDIGRSIGDFMIAQSLGARAKPSHHVGQLVR